MDGRGLAISCAIGTASMARSSRSDRAMVIRDRPTAPRSPWQNGYCERLIGSIRRECLDHVLVFGERHLRHLLRAYADYYNWTRTHLSLDKDSPASRAIEPFRSYSGCPNSRRIASPIRPDLVCDRDRAQWFWCLNDRYPSPPSHRGYAPTCAKAMLALKHRWRERGPLKSGELQVGAGVDEAPA